MVSQKQIADHLDLSSQRVRDLRAMGVLKRHGKFYDLDECRRNYIRWLRSRVPGGPAAPELNAERARLAAAQADRTEIEVQARRGELVEVEYVATLWQNVLANCRSSLLSLPSKLAPVVVGKTREETRAYIENAIHVALMRLAENPGTLRPPASKQKERPAARH